jgi:ferritin-like metal-binding protein YciE
MKLENLTDVLHHELKDLYSAEKQLLEALPEMAAATTADSLRKAIEMHTEETREHVRRLEELSDMLSMGISGETCEAMEGLIQEGEELIEDNEPSDALDAALIAAAQRIEHYEIAAYGSAATYAGQLGHDEAERLLRKTLDEEKQADEKLNKIAMRDVNKEALQR